MAADPGWEAAGHPRSRDLDFWIVHGRDVNSRSGKGLKNRFGVWKATFAKTERAKIGRPQNLDP